MSNQKAEKQPGYFKQIWSSIIRPPRLNYKISDLGNEILILKKSVVRRYDFNVRNERGLKIVGSYFEPMRVFDKPHHCVIYLHGNSSSRLEALGILEYLIPFDIAVVGFDFSGCGQSEGKYISLGYFEKEDVKSIHEWLRKNKPMVDQISLWGRSMGSVTAIMASKIIPDIHVLICDSPFSSLRRLCQIIAQSQYKIPTCLFSIVFCFIRRKIYSEAQFDIDNLNTLQYIQTLRQDVNILFLSAKQDTLIDSRHPTQLYEYFQGSKRICYFEGNHNSKRPMDINLTAQQFIMDGMKQYENLNQKTSKQQLNAQFTNQNSILNSQNDRQKILTRQIKPKKSSDLDEEFELINSENQDQQQQKIRQTTFVENIQQNNVQQ